MYFAAILPPNNAMTSIMSAKREIFRRTAVLSAWALKPMIPLVFTSRKPEGLSRNLLPALPPEGLAVNLSSESEGQCVLSSESCRAFCLELEKLFGSDAVTAGVYGLHLFDLSEADEQQSINKKSVRIAADEYISGFGHSVTHWKSCSLQIFRTDPGLFSDSGWWKRVVLEEVQQVSFPKK